MHNLDSIPYSCLQYQRLTKYTIVSNEGILPQSFLHDYEIDDVDQYLLEVLLLYGLAYLWRKQASMQGYITCLCVTGTESELWAHTKHIGSPNLKQLVFIFRSSLLAYLSGQNFWIYIHRERPTLCLLLLQHFVTLTCYRIHMSPSATILLAATKFVRGYRHAISRNKWNSVNISLYTCCLTVLQRKGD
jgi:hypothetical protein